MIQPKPFSFQQMLRRTIFKPRPSFFNAEDLNKQFSIIQEYVEKFNTHALTKSNIAFTVNVFKETLTATQIVRQINIQWQDSFVYAKGVRFSVPFGNASFEQTYGIPENGTPKPPTYVCLVAELTNVSYADDTLLAGIQSDQYPLSVPTVDVEQYKNVSVVLTDNPSNLKNCVIILGVFHPRYDSNGSELPFGFIYYTMNNQGFKILHGSVAESDLSSNGSLFDYLVNKVRFKISNLINERQLVRRYNLADIDNYDYARTNLGLSNVVNHRQLVRDENLKDLTNSEIARFNLGLGSSSTRNVGTGENDVASGVVMPIGAILMWSGNPYSIPTGWKLCDGSKGTPDLRGKFVVGLNTSEMEFNTMGKSGGEKVTKIKQENLPNVEFTIEQNPHTHKIPDNLVPNRRNGEGAGGKVDMLWEGYNNGKSVSSESIDIKVKSGGSDKELSNLPPYYTLCYIMFVGVNIPEITPPSSQPTLTYPNYSKPTSSTDGGYSIEKMYYEQEKTMGAGIVVMNPE